MADTKISNLPELTSPTGTDILPIVDNSTTKRITLANFIKTNTVFYIDGNRADTYVETGTIQFPFKTIAAAVDAVNTLTVPCALYISPYYNSGNGYVDAPATITTSVVIYGNGATFTVAGTGVGTWTFNQCFDIYDLNIIGNVVQTNTSLLQTNYFHKCSILGNLTILGYTDLIDTNCSGNGITTGLITIGSSTNSTAISYFNAAIIGINPTVAPAGNPLFCARIKNYGTCYILGSIVFGYDNTNYIIDSSATGSSLYLIGVRVFNFNTGKGISCANGATVINANNILNTDVKLVGSANGIDCGTAVTLINTYTITYSFGSTNTSGYVTGSNILSSVFSALNLSGSTSGATNIKATAVASGTLTLPAATDTVAVLATSQAFTNKTYNGFTLAGTTGTLTFQGTETYIGRATSDALTNKTYNGFTLAGTTGALTFQGSDTYVGRATTDTLTNKRMTPRVLTITSDANPTINTDNYDSVTITALAANIVSFTTNLSGTPVNFQKLLIRILDDGTARTIAWGTSFVQKGVPLPVTTVLGKRLSIDLMWDSIVGKWACVGIAQEF